MYGTSVDLKVGMTIEVVDNYAALPLPTSVPGNYYWVRNTQGIKWIPSWLGGSFYPNGLYYSTGTTWEWMSLPFQATQSEVDLVSADPNFLTPTTFNNASKWSTKQDTLGYTAEDVARKTDTAVGNETSSTLYLSVKGVVDWVTSLFTPKSRTLTINGDTKDLSADRSWTISSSTSWGGITGTLSSQTDLQTALDGKEPTISSGTTSQYLRGDKSWQTLDKIAVGLPNVDDTSDMDKPLSTDAQNALNLKQNANGYIDVIKASNQDVVNAISVNDTELFFPVLSGGVYHIKFSFIMSGDNTTADCRAYFRTVSATLTGRGFVGFNSVSNTTTSGMMQSLANFSAIISIGTPTANLNDVMVAHGEVVYHVSANDTITVGFGNHTATAGATSRMWAGSMISYKKIN